MSLKLLKNEKNVKLNKDGVYEFEHILVQGLDQTNVNAIVEDNRNTKINASEFLKKYDDVVKELKEQTRNNLEEKKKQFQEFLDGVTEENKTELALEYFEKVLESKKKFIDDFENAIEQSYKEVEKYIEPQKEYSRKSLEDADKTLELWSKFYKELPKEELSKEEKSE
jgi:hypothetical protein